MKIVISHWLIILALSCMDIDEFISITGQVCW